MTKIVAISGSLRAASFNSALVDAAVELFPQNIQKGSIEGIPLYNEDDEKADGIPTAVTKLKNQIAEASGLLIFTPEYNNSFPGVLKNAMDWLSRPPADIPKVFHGKPVALAGATPGGWGTVLAQDAWLGVFRTLKTQPWNEGRLAISRAHTLLGENGKLTDEDFKSRFTAYLEGFLGFIENQQ